MVSAAILEYTDRIELSMGDIIIDTHTGNTGILVNKTRHIDMVEDDIYLWDVKWNHDARDLAPVNVPTPSILEEEGLKLSIVVGIYEWHSVSGETFEI